MKGILDRLLKSLGFSGRDWAALLLALLLAFSTWLIHNLSLKYNDYLTVPVIAMCNLDGYAEQSSNQCEVVARCRATGYNVLRMDLIGSRKVRKVVFQPTVMKHKENDVFYVTSSDLLEYSHLIYGDDVTVEYFASDTLFFNFQKVDFKRVPVEPVYAISYRSQYTNVGDMELNPDSVTVYGDPYRLEAIERVYTHPIKRVELDADIQGVVPLEKLRNVRFSTSEAHYSLDVTRYVEVNVKLPVSAAGLPADKEMVILPSNVEVALRCSFPLTVDPQNEVSLYVDYKDFLASISGKCPVKVTSLPKGIIGYEIRPMYVECIVSDRR